MGACILDKIPLENRACGASGECLEGWTCVTQGANKVCVQGGVVEPSKETPADTVTEPTEANPEQKVETPVEPPPTDDAGTPEVTVDTPPDEPPAGLNCQFFTKGAQLDSCKADSTLSCYKIEAAKSFVESPKGLPVGLAGAVAVTNGDDAKTVNVDTPKVYIYVIGGGDKGAPGSDVYVTEIDRDGNIVEWKKTEAMATPRTNARAFLVDGYLIVAGGEGNAQTPIGSIERAKIKADGTLEPFKAVGTIPSPRKGYGITYQHGFFYTAGGNDGTTPSTLVERIPLLTDGTLGTPKSLPSTQQLPEGKEGILLSNHFSLYFVSKTDTKIFLGPMQGNGSPRGWCETTSMPKEVKSAQALLNARVLILYGIEKTSSSLDGRVYMSALRSGTGVPNGGEVQEWICSNADAPKGILTRPRKQAAAAVARGFLFIIGGVDGTGGTLKSVESVALPFQGSQCDLDADQKTNFTDNCSKVYNRFQKNLCDETMRLVPAGSFQRGDGGTDTPAKTITLDGFTIDATEVTIEAYQACVADTKCTAAPKDPVGGIPDYFTNAKYKKFPVVHVTWKQALTYCQWAGKRLPTEAEWEKAARGLTRFPYPWGDGSPTCQQANIGTCPDKVPVAVSQFAPGKSPYGVDDLAGNVREWVSDYFAKDYFKTSNETDNPKGPDSGTNRTIKSASYKSSGADAFKISARGEAKEDFRSEDLGFRCAVSVFPTAP